MTPLGLAALVAIASYFAISTLLATGVSAWWRTARPSALDASRLLAIRLLPAAGGLLLTACIVAPAFLRFEPAQAGERPGPVLLALGSAGFIVLLAGAARVLRAVFLTHRLRRQWLASASSLPALDGQTPAHLIDVSYPVVAIVGISRPVLVVSRTVVGGCSADEMQLIAAHERAHLRARDNLKRLAIDGCPDVLHWTRVGRDIAAAWSAMAEDAADDAATGGDRGARMALARVLVRVARMAVNGAQGVERRVAPELASALVGLNGVERRVRRLAESEPAPCGSRAGLYVGLSLLTAALAAAAANDRLLAIAYNVAETVVGLGR
jgi:Zn-dependent protease with chaperone function